jgi:hypothetical protein
VRARSGWLALVLVAARPAAGHDIPVMPSTCALDPIEISAPERGVVASVEPPVAGDVVRTTYDVQDWTAQFAAEPVVPRPFVADGVAGTVEVPELFVANLLSVRPSPTLEPLGDLVVPGASLAFALDAGGAASVPVRLSTGIAGMPGRLVAGSPMDDTGAFTLVGVVPRVGLPPPLDGALVVRIGCRAAPAPDVDQFRLATASRLRAGAGRRGGTFGARIVLAPGVGLTPDFTGVAAMLQASAEGTTIAAAYLPALEARGHRRFVGTSPDGSASIRVRYLRRRFGVDNYLLTVSIRGATLPPPGAGRRQVDVVYDIGGLLSRLTARFRANAAGTRLVFP